MKYGKISTFLNNELVPAHGSVNEIKSPYDDSVIGEVVYATLEDLNEVVLEAKKAQTEWAKLTFKKRAEIIFNFRCELQASKEELATCIKDENGKTLEEGLAAVDKAIELCEFACSIPALVSGRVQEVSKGIEVKEITTPVGIVSSITPFNFPLMVPMWTIPNTLVCGNAMLLKPSELTPITAILLGKLLKKAGLPAGLFSVVNGGKEIVEGICDHELIDVVTFVGSTPIAKLVYQRASANLKRCLAMGGAKNHIIVNEDVDAKIVAKEICSAAYGMSGQRCMAASVLIYVKDCSKVNDEIIDISNKMIVGKDLAPLITKEACLKIAEYLAATKGKILVDGRNFATCLDVNGYYIGPSIIEYEKYEDMEESELFGPSIEIIKVQSIQEALVLQNKSPYANGASIFTNNGRLASEAISGFSSGMLGVNIGVPVPRDPFSFGGLKASKFGYGDISGYDSLPLLTKKQKVTTKWNPEDKKDWMS